MQSYLYETTRETSCGCPTMIKTITNKYINKITNKYTFLDPKYPSQIMSDLHEMFGVTSCGCPTMIETKNKHIYKQTNIQTNK